VSYRCFYHIMLAERKVWVVPGGGLLRGNYRARTLFLASRGFWLMLDGWTHGWWGVTG